MGLLDRDYYVDETLRRQGIVFRKPANDVSLDEPALRQPDPYRLPRHGGRSALSSDQRALSVLFVITLLLLLAVLGLLFYKAIK